MAGPDNTRDEELSQLLTEAIEVQLAALKAGIGFWSEWIERTTEFVQSATKTLADITSEEVEAKDLLLELVDAGRASVRGMTEIPRNTATRFVEELDRLKAEREAAPKKKKSTRKKMAIAKKTAAKKMAAKKTTAKKKTTKRATAKKKAAPRKRAARAKP